MKDKKTHLFIAAVSKADGERIILTEDFKKIADAYAFLGAFKDEDELKEYYEKKTKKEFTDFSLCKTTRKTNKNSQEEEIQEKNYPVYYQKRDSYCTPENLLKVALTKAENYNFLHKIKYNSYITKLLDKENIIKAAPINKYSNSNEIELDYDKVYLARLEDLKSQPNNEKLKEILRDDLKVIIERMLYSSFAQKVIAPKKYKKEYNEGALRYLFDLCVTDKDIERYNLTPVKKKVMNSQEIEEMVNANFEYYTTLLDVIENVKEDDEEKRYTPEDNMPTYGDGQLPNQQYLFSVTITHSKDNKLCIMTNDDVFFLEPNEALIKFKDNVEILKEIKKFLEEEKEDTPPTR